MAKMVAMLVKGSLYVPNAQKVDKIFAKINKYYSLYQNDFESKLLVRFWNYMQLAFFTDQGKKIDILAIVNQFLKYALAHGKDEQVDRLTGEVDHNEARKLLKDVESAKTLILSFLVKIFRNIDGAEAANNFGEQQKDENDFFDRIQKIADLHSILSEIFGQIPSSIIHKYMLTTISDNNSHYNNQFLFRFFLQEMFKDSRVKVDDLLNPKHPTNVQFLSDWAEKITPEIEKKIISEFESLSIHISTFTVENPFESDFEFDFDFSDEIWEFT